VNKQIWVWKSKYGVTSDPLHIMNGSRDLLVQFRDPLYISGTV